MDYQTTPAKRAIHNNTKKSPSANNTHCTTAIHTKEGNFSFSASFANKSVNKVDVIIDKAKQTIAAKKNPPINGAGLAVFSAITHPTPETKLIEMSHLLQSVSI